MSKSGPICFFFASANRCLSRASSAQKYKPPMSFLPTLVLERIAQSLSVADLCAMSLVCPQWRQCAIGVLHKRVDAAITVFNQAKFQRHFQPFPNNQGLQMHYGVSWDSDDVFNIAARFSRQPLPEWCVRFLKAHCHYCKAMGCKPLNLLLREFETSKWLYFVSARGGSVYLDADCEDVYTPAGYASCVIFEAGLPHSNQPGTPVCPKQITAPELADVTVKFPKRWMFGSGPGDWTTKGTPGSVWFGNQSYDQVSLKAPYFLPSLHQFFQGDQGFDANKFDGLIEEFAYKLDEDNPWDDEEVGDGNPLFYPFYDDLCHYNVKYAFLGLLEEHCNKPADLLAWFEAQLPSLVQRCSVDELREWVHGWHNFYQMLNRGDPFQTIPEAEYAKRINSAFK